jgi:UDP-sulfoquinovose synthase
MRVLVLGGDGFCGWPTSLHLSSRGHDVHIVDNFSRRKIDVELEISSLTPIEPLGERLAAWREITGREIGFSMIDIAADPAGLLEVIEVYQPNAIVHFAEIRAAPYSMKTFQHRRLTVDHNVAATHNLLSAMVESGLDIHLAHLGTMGVYGYGGGQGATIPEGYLKVQVDLDETNSFTREILHPADPGSIYHMTKTMDQLLFYFYNKNDKLRITDLHQGIVWGTQTSETLLDPRLINRFDYDGDYGTVLNRFLVEAAIGHPLTVHGVGGQTRAFIHIRDTVRCIELALADPPARNERVRIFNQLTEAHRLRDLAQLVAKMSGAEIQFVANPRNEADENELKADNAALLRLGLEPTRLEQGLLEELLNIAHRYSDRCDRRKIPCESYWSSRGSGDRAARPAGRGEVRLAGE